MLQEVAKLYRDHLSPDLARLLRFGGPGTIETEALGTEVTDHLGRTYLDFSGGYGVFSLGHRHPEVVEAVSEQLNRLPMSSRVFLNEPQARLAAALAELAPGDLRYSFFCNSGAEAVEGALKLARLATGRPNLVSCHNSYHGKTLGSLSVTGREAFRAPFEPLLPGVRFVPFGDLAALEDCLDETVAAFIVEPVQGEGGIHVAPPGYLARARELCRERGCLLIADEVQCGLARTGRMFAVDHFAVVPDILVLAKALGGGVMPIGAYLAEARHWAAYKGRPTLHTSTFGGNPLACAAALATLRVLVRDDLAGRAEESGGHLRKGLERLSQRHPEVVSEVRGLGLMLGLELRSEELAGRVIHELMLQRVIAVYTLNQPRVIRLEPPLNVSPEHLERALEAFATALAKADQLVGKS